MFTQKGASQQGFLLLFLLFFPSLCGSLLLQEPAGLLQAGSGTGGAECCSRQGVLWVTFPDAADPSGPASLLLPRPSAWPPRAFAPFHRLPAGWGGTCRFFGVNPKSCLGFSWCLVTVPGWDLCQGWVAWRGGPSGNQPPGAVSGQLP